MKIIYTLLFSSLLLSCSSDNKTSSEAEVEKPQGVIPAYQLQALEKAKGTEQLLLDADEARRKEMEDRGI